MNGTTAVTPTTMKVIDRIAAYQAKQKQQTSVEHEQTSKLPAISLEFFPPKTQEGVVVRLFAVAFSFFFVVPCCDLVLVCTNLTQYNILFILYRIIRQESVRTHPTNESCDW